MGTYNKKIKLPSPIGSAITTNVFRMKAYDSIMFGYFCIEFIDILLQGKILTNFSNLFSSKNFKDNDKMILNYVKNG